MMAMSPVRSVLTYCRMRPSVICLDLQQLVFGDVVVSDRDRSQGEIAQAGVQALRGRKQTQVGAVFLQLAIYSGPSGQGDGENADHRHARHDNTDGGIEDAFLAPRTPFRTTLMQLHQCLSPQYRYISVYLPRLRRRLRKP